MPTPPEKRRVEGGVSVLRGALSGAEAAVEGLDSVQELPEACMLWAQAPLHRQALGKDSPDQTWRSSGLFLANSEKFFVFFPPVCALDLVFL